MALEHDRDCVELRASCRRTHLSTDPARKSLPCLLPEQLPRFWRHRPHSWCHSLRVGSTTFPRSMAVRRFVHVSLIHCEQPEQMRCINACHLETNTDSTHHKSFSRSRRLLGK